jgi:hypothetical protein
VIDSFTQSGLNMIVLYMSSRPKSVFVLTFVGPSNLVSKGKNSILLVDLL